MKKSTICAVMIAVALFLICGCVKSQRSKIPKVNPLETTRGLWLMAIFAEVNECAEEPSSDRKTPLPENKMGGYYYKCPRHISLSDVHYIGRKSKLKKVPPFRDLIRKVPKRNISRHLNMNLWMHAHNCVFDARTCSTFPEIDERISLICKTVPKRWICSSFYQTSRLRRIRSAAPRKSQ